MVVGGIPMLVSCAGGRGDDDDDAIGDDDDGGGAQTITETSTEVDGHTHAFTIPGLAIASPPGGGLAGQTTLAEGHFHDVSLTQQQLEEIRGGGSVTVTTSTVDGHSHQFTFELP